MATPGIGLSAIHQPKGKRTRTFEVVNGIGIEHSIKPRVGRRPPPGRQELPTTVKPPKPQAGARWIQNAREVLRFQAYFLEAVNESADENHRVRRCTILYYLENNTMQIMEERAENSGMPQGPFIRRGKIPNQQGDFFEPQDLRVGDDVAIYGRMFHIVDCDAFTRQCFPDQPAAESYPQDEYTTRRKELKMRDTGADSDVFRGKKLNPLKTFMEASLGSSNPAVKRRSAMDVRKMLENDRRVLQFNAIWDDTERLFGEKHKYRVNFFLADDTIEILEVWEGNSGKDPFPTMLRRCRCPRRLTLQNDVTCGGDDPEEECIEERDLRVGQSINVLNRDLLLYNADEFTFSWILEKYGEDMRTNVIDVEDPVSEAPRPQVPPYNGFGTEDDSLASCQTLVPKAPKRDFDKMMQNEGRVLRFEAKMENPTVYDRERKFVISYYLADDTVDVFEPPIRNSGITGGKWLARSKPINPTTSVRFAPEDFFVGQVISIHGTSFRVTRCDEYTLAYMEGNCHRFQHANISEIERQIRQAVENRNHNIRYVFRVFDKDHGGKIGYDEFKEAVATSLNIPLTDHEFITIFRRYDKDGDGTIDYQEFCEAMLSQDYGVSNVFQTTKKINESMTDGEIESYIGTLQSAEMSGREELELERAMRDFCQNVLASRDGTRLLQTFRSFDVDGSGCLSIEEFSNALRQVGNLTNYTIGLLQKKFFSDPGLEEINYDNFIRIIQAYLDNKNKGGQARRGAGRK